MKYIPHFGIGGSSMCEICKKDFAKWSSGLCKSCEREVKINKILK